MQANQKTLSQQLVRSTPGHGRSTNLPSHMVTSTSNPSQQGIRGNMVPSQDMMKRISIQDLTKSLSRPASSSSQVPRSVSVKKNRDGTKQVVVETSVSVSYTFQQEGYQGQDDGALGHGGQDDHEHPLPLEDGTAPGHQLVCCTCMVSMPRMQVGECGCLVCRDCIEVMEKPGYCRNCKAGVRYAELEKIIRFPDKGELGKLFMTIREREEFSTKEFLKRVLKEEKDFKIVDRILNKQEGAWNRSNTKHAEELEMIKKEEEELQKKIDAKSQAIMEMEEALRSRQQQQLQQQQDSRPIVQFQLQASSPMFQYPQQTSRLMIQSQQEASRPMSQHQPRLQTQHGDDREQVKSFDLNCDENQNPKFQHSVHGRDLKKDRMQVMEKQGEKSVNQVVKQEQMKDQVKQLLGKKMEVVHSDTNPPRNDIIFKVAGSSLTGVVASPAVGLKSILKKKIASRVFAEGGLAKSPLCGGEEKKEEFKQESGDASEKVRQDEAGSVVVSESSNYGGWRKTDKKVIQGRSLAETPGKWRKEDSSSMKGGRVDEAQNRSIAQVPGDCMALEEATISKKRGRMVEAQGRSVTQVPGDDSREENTTCLKRGRMENVQSKDITEAQTWPKMGNKRELAFRASARSIQGRPQADGDNWQAPARTVWPATSSTSGMASSLARPIGQAATARPSRQPSPHGKSWPDHPLVMKVGKDQDKNITQVCGDWRKKEMSRQIEEAGKLEENVTKVPNDKLEYDEKMYSRSDHASGVVSASQWMTRAVKEGAGFVGTGSTRNKPSRKFKEQQTVGRERKALTPLSLVRHPDKRTGDDDEAVTEKTCSSNKKEKHNMTYDYLDMIVNREGVEARGRPEAQDSGVSTADPYGVQGLAKSGVVAGRNSQVFWDQYLLQ